MRYVVNGDWRTTVQLSTRDVVERVLLADLPLEQAQPFRDMLERDVRARRCVADDVVFFRAGGQVRCAVYGQDVTVCP
jgi:hypothetical protein